MKIKTQKAIKISNKILQKWGFTKEEGECITENLIEAELLGKKSHGLMRLPFIKQSIDNGSVKVNDSKIAVSRNSLNSILIDGNFKSGYYVMAKSLELAFEKVAKSGLLAVGLTNTAPSTGLVGLYARKAAERNLIYVGFSNCEGGLVPFGSKQAIWGTNPFTVGIPSKRFPVILDIASSKINWGQAVIAQQEGKLLESGLAIDKDGNETTEPAAAILGGLLPFEGAKGSGLALMIELLAGALTGSRVGYSVPGGWGTFFILIDPCLFRPVNEFIETVECGILELKESQKMNGVKEIFYPGEQSQLLRQKQLKLGYLEMDGGLYEQFISGLVSCEHSRKQAGG